MTTFVTSRDGTAVAVSALGSGDPVVLVDGAFCHRTFGPMPQLAPLLAKTFHVVHHDRRGRGETGAGKSPWSIEREIEDVAAVVEHASSAAGGKPVCLYGTSSGAVLVARAVAAGVPVKKLALHEPPLSLDGTNFPNPPDFIAQIDRLIAANDPLGAARVFLRVVGVPAFGVFMMGLIPPVRRNFRACTHTLRHDFAILGDTQRGGPLPDELRQVFARITVPVLTAVGTKSAAYMHHAVDVVAKGLPQPPTRVVLKGQDHNVAATAIGPELVRFFGAA